MAGDWIKMTHSLRTAPEVVRISSALEADRLRCIGALYVLWCIADMHADPDGTLQNYTPEAVDSEVGLPGFTAAVADAGWLRIGRKSLSIPNFGRHNGTPAKRRAQDSRRKGAVRKVSASQADKTRNREEKRREENKDSDASASRDPPKPSQRGGPFVPPTIEEVAAYCQERGNGVDPEVFVAHYESNGWKVGPNPMRSWKSAVVTWEKNAKRFPDREKPGARKSKPDRRKGEWAQPHQELPEL